jgi:hypothetical protein
MEAQPQASEPKKSNKVPLIIGGILLACCFLAVVTIAVYQLVIAPKISNTFETINDTLQNTDLPSGGLAGDTLRRDVWMSVGAASSALGCTPDVAQTTIEVIQDPDSSGIWIEKWKVACTSGGQKVFDVTFTPTAGGGTDFSATTSP